MAASAKVEKELEEVKAINDEDEKEDPPVSTTYIPVLSVDTCDTLELHVQSSGTQLLSESSPHPPTALRRRYSAEAAFQSWQLVQRLRYRPHGHLPGCNAIASRVAQRPRLH